MPIMTNGENPYLGWIKVAAFDPALANWGMAKVLVHPTTLEMRVEALKLTHTEKENAKKVRVSSDDYRRATEAFQAAREYADWADLLVAEVPEGSQSSRAAIGSGVSIGLLAALGDRKPLFPVDPISVKKQVTGRKTASKDEMIAWAVAEFPYADWKRQKFKGELRLVDSNEHLADALAICRTALNAAEFKAAIQMRNAMIRS